MVDLKKDELDSIWLFLYLSNCIFQVPWNDICCDMALNSKNIIEGDFKYARDQFIDFKKRNRCNK